MKMQVTLFYRKTKDSDGNTRFLYNHLEDGRQTRPMKPQFANEDLKNWQYHFAVQEGNLVSMTADCHKDCK